MLKTLHIKCFQDVRIDKILKIIDNYNPYYIHFTDVKTLDDFSNVKGILKHLPTDLQITVETDAKNMYQDTVKVFNDRYVSVLFTDYDLSHIYKDYSTSTKYYELSNINNLDVKVLYEGIPFDLLRSLLNYVNKTKLFSNKEINFYPKLHCCTTAKGLTNQLFQQAYCGEYTKYITKEFEQLIKYQDSNIPLLRNFITDINSTIKIRNGCFCHNEYNKCVNTSGTGILCPYSETPDQYLFTYISDRCSGCELFPVCGNRCVADTTSISCEVFKTIYYFIESLCSNHNITINNLIGKLTPPENIYV